MPDRSLADLLSAIWRYRLMAGTIVIAVTILAGVAAWLWPLVYRAEVVLLPVEDNSGTDGLGNLLGGLGGLTAIAGISLPGSGQDDEAMAILESRSFTAAFIRDKELLPILFHRRWDSKARQWRPGEQVPDMAEAVEYFNEKVRQVKQKTGSRLVLLTVDWSDPDTAAAWANELAARLNETMRVRSIERANRSTSFLRGQIAKTDVLEVRESLYRLLESQLKTIVLAEASPEYSFRVVDPAVPPAADDFVQPKRPLIVALGLLLGCVLAGLAVVIRESVDGRRPSVPKGPVVAQPVAR